MNEAKYDDHALAERVAEVVRARIRVAFKRYHERYDNDVFARATEHNGFTRTNALLDSAMALCGHPRCSFIDFDWNDQECAFLALFID